MSGLWSPYCASQTFSPAWLPCTTAWAILSGIILFSFLLTFPLCSLPALCCCSCLLLAWHKHAALSRAPCPAWPPAPWMMNWECSAAPAWDGSVSAGPGSGRAGWGQERKRKWEVPLARLLMLAAALTVGRAQMCSVGNGAALALHIIPTVPFIALFHSVFFFSFIWDEAVKSGPSPLPRGI